MPLSGPTSVVRAIRTIGSPTWAASSIAWAIRAHSPRCRASPPMKISLEDAKVLRVKLCHAQTPAAEVGTRPAAAAAGAAAAAAPATMSEEAERVAQACREPLSKLIEELALCRRYHEATFPSLPVDRLVFVGGEARHRGLCQEIAQGMDLAAQVGDPLIRMGRVSEVGIESGLDRRLPQPDWAVAIGSSMGPVAVVATAEAAK